MMLPKTPAASAATQDAAIQEIVAQEDATKETRV